MSEPIAVYPCPAGDGNVEIRTTRQLRVIESGRDVYHNRECQNAANRETRPCCVCDAPVTRSKSKFGEGKVTCPEHRGGWKSNKKSYECANPPCPNVVARTPAHVHGAVYCSQTCSGKAQRSIGAITASCSGCDIDFTLRDASQIAQVNAGRPVYHSKECRRDATRAYFSCSGGCGRTVWRYRSVLGEGFEDRPHRIFCPECHEVHGAKKRNGTTKPCAWCGEPVYRKPSEDDGGPRYCGHSCWGAALREAKSGDHGFRACVICDRPFPLDWSRVRQDVKTCSRKCQGMLKRRKKGERYVDKHGYVWITTPDGQSVLEHRYVMEQHLGRPLLTTETVHHKKGGKRGRSNNNLDNLELWTGNHPKGHRIEDVLQYAGEMQREYAPQLSEEHLAGMVEVLESRGFQIRRAA